MTDVPIESIEASQFEAKENSGRKRVLVSIGTYLPGYKAGGPIKSVSNLIAELSPYYEFFVITLDRESADAGSYIGINSGHWYTVGNAKVLYCERIDADAIKRAVLEAKPDLLYLSSFQSVGTRIAMTMRWKGLLKRVPVIIAPRGEFSTGARNIKRWKKLLYLYGTRMLGIHRDVTWQVSTPNEKLELLRAAPSSRIKPGQILVAPNINRSKISSKVRPQKRPGIVKLICVARICEMKNIHFLLEVLKGLHGDVRLDLYGPIDNQDMPYWQACKSVLDQLPENVHVEYQGAVESTLVPDLLHEHHFFILPTRGENFCHAAVEAFLNGTPVLLSNNTPWVQLEEVRAGFDISLEEPQRWREILQRCIEIDQETYDVLVHGSAEYGRKFSVEEAVKQHLALFQAALKA